jgi:hypothetical protein
MRLFKMLFSKSTCLAALKVEILNYNRMSCCIELTTLIVFSSNTLITFYLEFIRLFTYFWGVSRQRFFYCVLEKQE